MLKIRKSKERGFANRGWLKSYHSFSFADYYDENHMSFGNLRVINEDYIAANKGFDTHPHRDMEIITYVISGSLKHQDSMNNSSVINPNEVQIMSAGTGVFHSEFSNSLKEETHLLQIWILPNQKGISPRYDQRSFTKELEKNNLILAVSGKKQDGVIFINQDVDLFIGKFLANDRKTFTITNNHKIWIQLIKGELLVNNVKIIDGDAIAIDQETQLEITALKDSEFLLFDMA